jgi:sec-independent protein translocase protein TatB
MSFSEFAVLLLVALIVLGPKELPRYLRKAGQFAGRARVWANDMRRKSGIDEVLRMEGIDQDIAEIRKLTRGEITGILGSMHAAANSVRANVPAATAYTPAPVVQQPAIPQLVLVDREREYPRDGPDSYGALPDTAVVYEGLLPRSPLADDPLYARGEETREGAPPAPRPAVVGLPPLVGKGAPAVGKGPPPAIGKGLPPPSEKTSPPDVEKDAPPDTGVRTGS